MSECKEIVVTENGGVLEVSIQRPDRKNALTHAMYTAINRLSSERRQPSVRVLLITGTSRLFYRRQRHGGFSAKPAAW
jgi:enoyl-CoA hydratase/carnithine racemase